MSLRVHIDQERLVAEPCEAGRKVDAGRRFTAAALLIDDRDGPHWGTFLGNCRADPSAGSWVVRRDLKMPDQPDNDHRCITSVNFISIVKMRFWK
jgi:hypothetical protein